MVKVWYSVAYMPYVYVSRDRVVEYDAVIGSTQSIIDRRIGSIFVFGGDFNVNKYFSYIEYASLRNFCWSNKLS